MNSSAKMRRRIAGLALVSPLVALCAGAVWVTRHAPPLPAGEVSTLNLPDPVELTDGDTILRVTRIALDPRHGLLTLEQDELTFDDYGDATRTGGKPPRTIGADVSREFRLTTFMVRPEWHFDQRLRLAALPGSANTYRLIVLRRNWRGEERFERILELRGPEIVPDELGNAPQPERFAFQTLGRNAGDAGRELYGIGVSGSLAGGGRLSIDPNYYTFHSDGSVGGSTDLGWFPIEVTFRPLGPDPANRGRRAFELVPTKAGWPDTKGQYILVLGPTELSEHRLVIKADGRVKQVLALRNGPRDNHLYMTQRFKVLPADERAAYRELGKLTGYRAGAVSDEKTCIYCVHSLDGDAARFDAVLRRFPRLRRLGFTDATLPATGLPCLGEMQELAELGFNSCALSNEGMASVGKATGLRQFSAYKCKGPTSAGLAHLAPLTNLESLDLRREDQPNDAPVLDDGLEVLAGMPRLTRLNLSGQKVTDAGLAHIGRVKTLRELFLSGDGITDDGLKHLEGLALTEFAVYGPYSSQLSYEAVRAFRAKPPNLRK